MRKTFTCHDMFHMALGQLWDCPCSGKATREDRSYSSHTEPCGNGWYNQNKIPMRMIPGLYGVIYISWFGCQHSKCREFSLDFVSLFEWCHRLHHDATESLITRENWKKTCPTFQSALRLLVTWWRHQMETFSALLALCAGNSPVTGEFPSQMPVTRSFSVCFDLRPNNREAGIVRRHRAHHDVTVMI